MSDQVAGVSAGGTAASRTAVVIGGTGGIGRAVCRAFVAAGVSVRFTYRSNVESARILESETDGDAVGEILDVRDSAAIADYFRRMESAGFEIGTLVYAAGPLVRQRHLRAISPAEMSAVLESDSSAFYAAVHSALPALRRAGGSVVAVTTAATRRYAVRDGMSIVPKASVEAIVRGIAVEEGRYGVRANSVGPGMLSDGMAARLIEAGDLDDNALEQARRNTPLRRFGTTADIAAAVVFLASDEANFITGQKLDVDGGYGA